MILADSNIVIYAAKGIHPELRDFVRKEAPAFSAVSYVEALGYHHIDDIEKRYLEKFFAVARVFPISDEVVEEAVRLRQMRKMGLGDAFSAGTALVHGFRLATRNVQHFRWIHSTSSIRSSLARGPYNEEAPHRASGAGPPYAHEGGVSRGRRRRRCRR